MSMPMPPGLASPPGFLSPAAFPFPNGPYPLANDAPPPGVPYLIGTASSATASATLTLITGSGAGDTIAVLAFTDGASTVTSCTDTEGNSYSIAVLLGSATRFAQVTAVNPAPLKPGDSVTVTWTASGFHEFTVIGLPGAAAGAPGGNLIPDAVAVAQLSTTAAIASIPASSLSSPAEVAVAYILTSSTGTIGPLNWPPDWTVLISAPFPPVPATFQYSVAYKVLTSRAAVRASLLFAGNAANGGLCISTFMPETRFATQPGIAQNAAPAPPGLMSPGAWPVLPPPPQTVNDAPPTIPVPYFIGSASGTAASTSITIPVQNPTGHGDAIIVSNLTPLAAPGAGLSCTDTQGNSYVVTSAVNNAGSRLSKFIAVNPVPLGASDSITLTFPSTASTEALAVGCPPGAAGAGASFLTYGSFAGGAIATGATVTITNSGVASFPPDIVIATASDVIGNGPPQFPQGWTVIGQVVNPSIGYIVTASKVMTASIASGAAVLWTTQKSSGVASLDFVVLIPETRFAPRGPLPDMPPGMQSPGAWQYAPLHAPEGPASTKYASSPYKWTETLPAVTASAPAIVKTTGKLTPATPHPAGTIKKGTGKSLAATSHPAGKLARSTAKHLTAAARTATGFGRALAAALTAAVRVAARLLISAPARDFTLGTPYPSAMSRLSTSYYQVPVNATKTGAPYNPTPDTVQMAFMPLATQVPKESDWVTGGWDANPASILYPWNAKVLVGPGGAIALGLGTYIAYLRIIDDPQIPVLIAGQFQIH